MTTRTYVKDYQEFDEAAGVVSRRVKQVWEKYDADGILIERSWAERVYENGIFIGSGEGQDGAGSPPYNWE